MFFFVSAALSVFIVGNWIAWPSTAVKNIIQGNTKMSMNSEQVSWAVALLDFGNVISPIPSGYITNYLGRKRILVILSFLLFASWLLTIFGTTPSSLYAARFIVGICKGLAFTVVPIYLGEIAGTTVRGGVGTIFCSMMNYGILFELCIAPLVTYETLSIICSPFPVLFFLFFFRFPESPYFLIMKGSQAEAKKSLAWFRNLDESSPVLELEIKQISANVEEDMSKKGGYKDLMSTPDTRRAMLITVGLAVLQRLSGMSSIIAYSAITLPPTGGYFSPDVYMVFFGITAIIGQSVCIALIDKLGRKPLLIISCAGCALSNGISALFYWLREYKDIHSYNWVPYMCVILYGIMFAIGIGTIPSVITVELFKSNLRSNATSVAAICYAVGSFATNKLYLFLQSMIGTYFNFILFAISSLLCLILSSTIYFETNGKSFTEIQTILKQSSVKEKPDAEKAKTDS